MESTQEQRYQAGNNRKGDPLAETEALSGVGHRAILQAGKPGGLWSSATGADSAPVLLQIAVLWREAEESALPTGNQGCDRVGMLAAPFVDG